MYEGGRALLAYEDTDELDDQYPPKVGSVAASVRTACMFEPLPAIYGIPQTKVTFVARVDVRGIVPAAFTNAFVGRYFSNLSKMRSKFERDQEIDRTSRAAIYEMIKAVNGHHAANFGDRLIDMQSKVRNIVSVSNNNAPSIRQF